MNDLQQITRALAYTSQCYTENPLDPIGFPFIYHPIAVLDELVQSGVTDTVTLVTSVLHDVTQWTTATKQDISEMFGCEVASLVEELDYKLPETDEDKTGLQLDLIGRAHELSQAAQDITLADMTANIRWHLFDDYASDWTRRKRIAWARAVVDELPTPNPLLLTSFNLAHSSYATSNDLPEDDDYWDFVEKEEVEDDAI